MMYFLKSHVFDFWLFKYIYCIPLALYKEPGILIMENLLGQTWKFWHVNKISQSGSFLIFFFIFVNCYLALMIVYLKSQFYYCLNFYNFLYYNYTFMKALSGKPINIFLHIFPGMFRLIPEAKKYVQYYYNQNLWNCFHVNCMQNIYIIIMS